VLGKNEKCTDEKSAACLAQRIFLTRNARLRAHLGRSQISKKLPASPVVPDEAHYKTDKGRRLRYRLLKPLDLVGLRAFLPLNNVKLDIIAFFQALVAVDNNGAVMDEDIRAIIAADEAVAFCIVEPFNFAFVLGHRETFLISALVMGNNPITLL
jgi:hypothetical protein